MTSSDTVKHGGKIAHEDGSEWEIHASYCKLFQVNVSSRQWSFACIRDPYSNNKMFWSWLIFTHYPFQLKWEFGLVKLNSLKRRYRCVIDWSLKSPNFTISFCFQIHPNISLHPLRLYLQEKSHHGNDFLCLDLQLLHVDPSNVRSLGKVWTRPTNFLLHNFKEGRTFSKKVSLCFWNSHSLPSDYLLLHLHLLQSPKKS